MIATYDETQLNATVRGIVAAMLPKVALQCADCSNYRDKLNSQQRGNDG